MAHRIPVILSRARRSDEGRRSLEVRLADALLCRSEVELHMVAHLYDLSSDGPAVQLLKSIPGDMIVLAHLYPRSAYWVLDAHRVRGRPGRTSLHLDGDSYPDDDFGPCESPAKRPGTSDRTIWCLDLRAHHGPEPYVTEIARIAALVLGQGAEGAAAGPPRPACEIKEAVRARWYPVVDYARCTRCLECLNFCLFGVYGLDESGAVVAEEPDACRPGCPACARICPAGAIMFPEHSDPAIAGGPAVPGERPKLDLSQLPGGDDPGRLAAAERDRALAEDDRPGRHTAPGPTPSGQAADDLDRLVDEVDEMEL